MDETKKKKKNRAKGSRVAAVMKERRKKRGGLFHQTLPLDEYKTGTAAEANVHNYVRKFRTELKFKRCRDPGKKNATTHPLASI